MTPAEAEALPEKAWVKGPHTIPPHKPFQVTEVWVNATKTIGRLMVRGRKGWSDVAHWVVTDRPR